MQLWYSVRNIEIKIWFGLAKIVGYCTVILVNFDLWLGAVIYQLEIVGFRLPLKYGYGQVCGYFS